MAAFAVGQCGVNIDSIEIFHERRSTPERRDMANSERDRFGHFYRSTGEPACLPAYPGWCGLLPPRINGVLIEGLALSCGEVLSFD